MAMPKAGNERIQESFFKEVYGKRDDQGLAINCLQMSKGQQCWICVWRIFLKRDASITHFPLCNHYWEIGWFFKGKELLLYLYSLSALLRPQASLGGQVRRTLCFGIDCTRFAGHCGTNVNGKGYRFLSTPAVSNWLPTEGTLFRFANRLASDNELRKGRLETLSWGMSSACCTVTPTFLPFSRFKMLLRLWTTWSQTERTPWFALLKQLLAV